MLTSLAGGPILNLLDLSKATKLKKVEFEIDQRSPQDVVAVLRTLTNNHQNLQWISISTTYAITGREFAGTGMSNVNRLWLPNAVEAWLELDRLVAQLWESRRTRMRVQYCSTVWEDRGKARSCMEDLLPQLTMRGAVDIIEKMIY